MQEIKISYPDQFEQYPNLIETEEEEIQLLLTILQDLAPWEDRINTPENLPVKISGETFILTLEEQFKKEMKAKE